MPEFFYLISLYLYNKLNRLLMDPINIIIGINVIALFGANIPGAKKGIRSVVSQSIEKPKTYLQTLPPSLATLSLVLLILSIFQIGALDYTQNLFNIRVIALVVYLVFSWIQIWAYKSLGDNYSQNILLLKNHSLVTKGPFKIIRHPQYIAQIIGDLSVAVAVMSYIVLPIALLEIPFIIMRASLEEKMLSKHFGDSFTKYKKSSGFMFPFIG
jgi:protein-S-isoprenylcysteine O-methyltransferase Ste14